MSETETEQEQAPGQIPEQPTPAGTPGSPPPDVTAPDDDDDDNEDSEE
jgi:hypothetical protein